MWRTAHHPNIPSRERELHQALLGHHRPAQSEFLGTVGSFDLTRIQDRQIGLGCRVAHRAGQLGIEPTETLRIPTIMGAPQECACLGIARDRGVDRHQGLSLSTDLAVE